MGTDCQEATTPRRGVVENLLYSTQRLGLKVESKLFGDRGLFFHVNDEVRNMNVIPSQVWGHFAREAARLFRLEAIGKGARERGKGHLGRHRHELYDAAIQIL